MVVVVVVVVIVHILTRKEMFNLTMHSTHFMYCYINAVACPGKLRGGGHKVITQQVIPKHIGL